MPNLLCVALYTVQLLHNVPVSCAEPLLPAGVRVLAEAGAHRDPPLLLHRHTQCHHHYGVSDDSAFQSKF